MAMLPELWTWACNLTHTRLFLKNRRSDLLIGLHNRFYSTSLHFTDQPAGWPQRKYQDILASCALIFDPQIHPKCYRQNTFQVGCFFYIFTACVWAYLCKHRVSVPVAFHGCWCRTVWCLICRMAERGNSKRSLTRVAELMRSRTPNETYSTKPTIGYKRSEMCTKHIRSDLMKLPPKFLLFKQHGTLTRAFSHWHDATNHKSEGGQVTPTRRWGQERLGAASIQMSHRWSVRAV